MDKITCIIVDDEALAIEGLRLDLQKFPHLEVLATFTDAQKALDFLSNHSCNVIFTDINMPGINGLEFTELLKSIAPQIQVVLVTAYREFALEGFDLHVVDYLLKPLSFKRLSECVLKLQQTSLTLSSIDKDYFFIKCDGNLIKINFADILYVEGLKDYVFIHTIQQKHLTLLSLKNIEKKLPPQQFLRIHRSFIIQTAKITQINGNQIQLKSTKNLIPIGKSYLPGILPQLIGNNLWKRE